MGKKYYVVWNGMHTGVYDSWDECELQIKNYPGARFKSFPSKEEAIEAYRGDPSEHIGVLKAIAEHVPSQVNYEAFPEIELDAIAVDAACAGNPGPVEYRGVHVRTGQEIFRVGPLQCGTNNIGEYLAIVHALALLARNGRTDTVIYSDSRTAQAWVRNRQPKTTVRPTPENANILEVMNRATRWLQTHSYSNPIRKWETERWGEIPADFGRK